MHFSSSSSLDCSFMCIQPPREDYWSFQCTYYPAWPWMSLWTAVCLDEYVLMFLLKTGSLDFREYVGFWLLIFVKYLLWDFLKVPICDIEWALTLADQHLCVGVYVWEQYLHIHTHTLCVCVFVHAHVGKSTGRYILLCHHLCPCRQQATSYTLTLSIKAI